MLHLRTFGGLAVTVDAAPGTGAAQQRKTLALLALLAAAGRSGLSRDKLLAYLWPDADADRARGLLKQACYALRRDLRAPDLFLGTTQLRMNPDVIASDVGEFEAALERGDLAAAAQVYTGPFLDGFYLSEAAEFERWVETQRSRLRERATAALERLATDAAAAGDRRGAVAWWRRLATHDALNTQVVLGLMRALAAAGDRAGALKAATDHEALLREELEAAPDPAVRDLAERLRAELAAPPAPSGQVVAAAPVIGRGGDIEQTVGEGSPRFPLSRIRRSLAIALGVAGLAAGWWLLGAPVRARLARTTHTPKRIVVLRFTNLGSADQAYFADGLTEEITARLGAVADLQVLGAASGNAYRETGKTIQDIGKDFRVDYVLAGSVRWENTQQGTAQVRVTPHLVSAADGAQLWGQVYDEPLEEIFQVQTDIAQQVVQALHVTLLEPQGRMVEAIPTHNLEAYDYYLRGNDYVRRGATEERPNRAALQMYERAVELDPGFALAYGAIARADCRMYWFYYDRSPDRLRQAKDALDKALALQPALPELHQALGTYYFMGFLDYDRALAEYAVYEASRPNEPGHLLVRAVLHERQGRLRDALADYERATQLNPAGSGAAENYALAYDLLRDTAHAEALYARAIALAPDRPSPYFWKTWLYLKSDGNTRRARAVLDQARAAGVADDPRLIYTQVACDIVDGRYHDAIGRLSSAAPEAVTDLFRVIPRAQLYALVYHLMGRRDLERAYSDSALAYVSAQLQQRPNDPRLHSALGIAYAGLGRKADAIREGGQAVALIPISKDTHAGQYPLLDLARIYAMVGEHAAAEERLEQLLSMPGPLTAAWLRIDPTWAPLRGDARFQRLITQAP